MSITFSIEGIEEETGNELPCPKCGVSLATACLPENHSNECELCQGYGGPAQLPEPQFELNVANGNGYALLEWMGLGAECAGDAHPWAILIALNTQDASPLQSVDVDAGVVHYCGRTAEQVARYVEKLRKIALKASDYDRKVVWG